MIYRVVCAECDESLHLVRGHENEESAWGSIILSEDQLRCLSGSLKAHRGKACKHFAALKHELTLAMLDVDE
jgi:hypothetical protein